jgi:acyl-CoA synthetase (AMP-forming)/AMP-acid ligase II
MTLQAALAEGARAFPDRQWFSCDGQAWTYAEGDEITDRLARGLMAAGVRPGDRVALLFGNGPEIVFSYYACFKIGAIAVPLNIRFAPPELAYVLGHCEAKILLEQDQLCRAVMPLRSQLPHLRAVHVAGDVLEGAGSFEALFDGGDGEPTAFPAVEESQIAALLYTSGTTAKPKGVIHTHAGLRQMAENMFDALGRDTYARTVVSMPMCHIGGFSCMVAGTQAGGRIWTLPRFDPEQVLELLQRSRATMGGALPFQAKMLVDHPRSASFDLSALRGFLCGGDCVQADLQDRFLALFGAPLDEICGMTEVYYATQPLARGERRPGTVGKPFGDVRIALLGRTGEPVGEGEVGEFVVQSAAMTLGYWNDPASTAAAIRNGWLWTGDLGSRDAEGFYRFEGRSKDVIIRGGSNISPGEVEDALVAHPAVAESGVVGAPDAELGQVVWAYVALRAGERANEAELVAWAGERIAAYKVPERILFMNALPKGVTGKINRKALRERAAAEREPARAEA